MTDDESKKLEKKEKAVAKRLALASRLWPLTSSDAQLTIETTSQKRPSWWMRLWNRLLGKSNPRLPVAKLIEGKKHDDSP